MAQEKVATPQSSAGIIRFYDINSSNIQIDPRLVVGFAAALVLMEIALQAFVA